MHVTSLIANRVSMTCFEEITRLLARRLKSTPVRFKQLIMAYMIWEIWKLRNNIVFSSGVKRTHSITLAAAEQASEFWSPLAVE